MKRIIEAIKNWWHGKDTFQEYNQYDHAFFPMPFNKKHWTSSLVHWLVSLFTNLERRSIFLAILGFITFIFMLLKFFTDTNTEQNTYHPDRNDREHNIPMNEAAYQQKSEKLNN